MSIPLRLLLPFFIPLSLICFGLPAQTFSWEKYNAPPGGGSLVYEGNPGNLFVMLDPDNLFRSTDNGLSWQKTGDFSENSWAWPLTVGLDGNLYGRQNSTLLRSADNGDTWQPVGMLDHEKLFVFPGGDMLAGDLGFHIRRSTNGGQTWETVLTAGGHIGGFAYNPVNGDVYAWQDYPAAGENGRVWRSSDKGLTWTVLLDTFELDVHQIAVSPGGGIFAGAEAVIRRSLDNGNTWTTLDPRAAGASGPVDVAVAASGRLFACDDFHSFFSDDNGDTWLPLTDASGNAFRAFATLSDGTVFALRRPSGSLYRSDNNGDSWVFSTAGISFPSIREWLFLDETRFLARTNDGLFYSGNDAAGWSLVWNDIAGDAPGRSAIAASPTGAWFLWTGLNLIRFADTGQTNVVLNTGFVHPQQFQGLWAHPKTGDLFLTTTNGLYRSGDSGMNWILVAAFNTDNLLFMPDGSMLSNHSAGLFKSSDTGETWSLLSPVSILSQPPTLAPDGALYGLNTQPALLFSPDQGLTWETVAIDYPYPFSTKPVVNSAGHIFILDAFAGPVIGSVDGGRTFNPLPDVPVFPGAYPLELALSPAQRLYLTVGGQGIFRTTVPTTQVKLLRGRVFHDLDAGCELAVPDSLVSGIMVTATRDNVTTYAVSNSAGVFVLPVSAGDYQVKAVAPNPYWLSCEELVTILNDTLSGVVDSVDPGLRALTACPYAEVHLTAPFLRRCYPNAVQAWYQNGGSLPAEDAFLEITLDEYLNFDSASLPVASQNGRTYRFELGDLPPGAQGSATVTCTPSCDIPIGYIHCIRAHIFPDSLCPPYSGPQIRTSAECLGDSVRLHLENAGDENMDTALEWHIVHPQDSLSAFLSGTFKLNAGQVFTTAVAAGIPEVFFYAKQPAEYPLATFSVTSIQGCGVDTIPLSIVNEDEEGPASDVFCRRNIGSFDPNDKTGFPTGFTSRHYIELGQPLEYLVRFQNTGTDTAFHVTIRDTLSPLLNPASVRLTGFSHPCRLNISPAGVLLFSFENILLPDSNVNEPASHGYVQFRLEQGANSPFGAEIQNSAAIYFDYNDPVYTNNTLHTNGLPITTTLRPEPKQKQEMWISPNPMRESALLKIDEKQHDPGESFVLELFDSQGRQILATQFSGPQTTIARSGLPAGAYVYVVKRRNGRLVGKGILVLE
ncbi:MAG: T9SS type A sorting domain-containing protein [Saprospiraceae bacterium]|nr:T9SS type A sorting domain-containing protein [Saprospiraceae bacterium]